MTVTEIGELLGGVGLAWSVYIWSVALALSLSQCVCVCHPPLCYAMPCYAFLPRKEGQLAWCDLLGAAARVVGIDGKGASSGLVGALASSS